MTFLDGGMGTLLQARGLQPGEAPEDWNVERPDDVTAIHRAYVDVGSQIVYANTFGANPLKYHGRHTLSEVIRAGVANAKRACGGAGSAVRVALDLGPTGRLLKPAGDLSFDAAVAAFAETIRLATRDVSVPDLIVIETMGDLLELKAAIVAARETCDLPILATVTLGEDGRLLTGASVEAVAALFESLDVAAYGFNCGLGPDRMLPYVRRLAQLSTKPIVVKPNAGLPSVVDGKTVFAVGPDEFAADVKKLAEAGASFVGGCCGTTPAHIGAVCSAVAARAPAAPGAVRPRGTVVASGTSAVELQPGQGTVIGERINPTGKRLLKEAFLSGDTAYVLREAVRQVEAGAAILDVNCGVPGIDEVATLEATVEAVQGVVACPIQVDTANPAALARALRRVNGKALVNSVNGAQASMDAVFPLVKRYGGTIVALCLDEKGVPPTVEGRLAVARRILAEGRTYGFSEADFVFDALTLAVSAEPNAALVTLETVRRLTEELHVNTVLGVSNVSFGLPNRPALNNAMYALAKRAGLSAAIANPSLLRDEIDPAAEDVLLGRDRNCERWIARAAAQETASAAKTGATATDSGLVSAIRRGLKDDARAAAEAEVAAGRPAQAIIQEGIVPALEEIGKGFETGRVFLPQLLMAADAAGAAFEVVRRTLPKRTGGAGSPPIVLATVKGDVHDIGKNIVRALWENYGFDVIDLGRDVPPETIVDAARESGAFLVGLSALMTTTLGAMAETIRQLKAAGLSCKTVVGGAVVTQDYADRIGADYYAKDAMRSVRIAEALVGSSR